MKKPVLAIGVVVAAILSACSSEGQADSAWYEKNCDVEVSDVREKFEQGEPTGEVIGEAMTQGPITPPAGLNDSEHAQIGLYTYDELADAMELEREVEPDDTFCLEPAIRDKDNRMSLDPSRSVIEGNLHDEGYEEVDFTKLRSEEYPEGIWVGLGIDQLPQSIEVSDNMPEQCDLQWWSAKGLDFTTAKKGEDTTSAVIRADEC